MVNPTAIPLVVLASQKAAVPGFLNGCQHELWRFPMAQASHTAGARAMAVTMAALLLGACSSTSASDTTAGHPATSATSAQPTTQAPAASSTSVDVAEKEYSITLSQATFKPGTYTFTIKNTGSMPHNLAIEGPGVDKTTSPTIGGGQSGSLTVALQAGSYELSCSIPGHQERGMDMRVKVG